MSKHKTDDNPEVLEQFSMDFSAENFNIEEDPDWNPVTFSELAKEQKSDALLKKRLGIESCQLINSIFHGRGRNHCLWTFKEKICVPTQLQKRVVEWCHNRLLCPGQKTSKETISQHFWWSKMRDHIRWHVKTCPMCQKNKTEKFNCGHFPPKETEVMPWDKMCIKLIGPCEIRQKCQEVTNIFMKPFLIVGMVLGLLSSLEFTNFVYYFWIWFS